MRLRIERPTNRVLACSEIVVEAGDSQRGRLRRHRRPACSPRRPEAVSQEIEWQLAI
jgi:hypothetical protein